MNNKNDVPIKISKKKFTCDNKYSYQTSVNKNGVDYTSKISNKKVYDGISIITCTNRKENIKNIFNNYDRQKFKPKELIIILNKDNIDLDKCKQISSKYNNVSIYKVDQLKSLGYCLNFAIKKSKYHIIAKFDDDDYYGPSYISNSIKAFKKTNAHVVGKASTLVYFKQNNVLAIRSPHNENKYVKFVNGSTLLFNKDIFNSVRFKNTNIAEDVYFCRDCHRKGIRIYSTDIYDHVYIRNYKKKNHTWKISDKTFINKYCTVIKHTDNYIQYANSHNS